MSLTIIAICQVIMTLAVFSAVLVLVYAVFAFKALASKKIDEALARVQPVVDDAKSIAEQARDTTERVCEKVDFIMTRAEATANCVSDRVESVSGKVEEAISPQVVTAAGILETGLRLVRIYQGIVRLKEAGEHKTERGEAGQGEVDG